MTAQAIQQRLQQGYRSHLSGDARAAAAVYAEVLQADPENADAWHLSGLVAHQQKRHDDAEQLIRHALHLRPAERSYESNLAAVLLVTGKAKEAEQRCRRILRDDPSHVDAMRHLGTALRKQRRIQEAAEVCESIVRRQPADVDALCNLGVVLADMGRVDEAHQTLLKARSLNSFLPQIHLNLGSIQRQLGRFEDAMASLDLASELAPDLAEAATNRGNLLLEMGRPDQAIQSYDRALSLNPRSAMALSGIGQALQVLGQWSEAMEAFRLACICDDHSCGTERQPSTTGDNAVRRRLVSNMLYCATLAPHLNRTEVFELHQSWGQAIENSVQPVDHNYRLRECAAQQDRPLRIGYLSPDFRSHATMRFFLPFFLEHDRRNVELYCYSETVRVDETTEVVRSAADFWRTTSGRTDSQVAELIYGDQIDILVDLAGHTAGNRLAALAGRPAPVQVSFLGYPGTTGLSRVDYFLTDAMRENGESAALFTEELVLMPRGACCYNAGTQTPEVAEPPILTNGYITLGSTHRLEKLSPACLQVWGQVMAEIPDARLLIIRDVLGSSEALRNNLRKQLELAGIDNARVDLCWELPASHLNIYSRMDVLLDVFPWPSGTTAYEAMWMGVPVPAMGGGLARSRQSASFLHYCGLPELIAESAEEYVSKVADLTLQLGELCRLRRTLRDQMRMTVCNGRQFARDLEMVYRQMWRRRCGVPFDDGQLRILSVLGGAES